MYSEKRKIERQKAQRKNTKNKENIKGFICRKRVLKVRNRIIKKKDRERNACLENKRYK